MAQIKQPILLTLLSLVIIPLVACGGFLPRNEPPPPPQQTEQEAVMIQPFEPSATSSVTDIPTEVPPTETPVPEPATTNTPMIQLTDTPAPQAETNGNQPPPGSPPDMAMAAEILGIPEQTLKDAIGPPPPDFAASAQTLGIDEEILKNALDAARGTNAPPPNNNDTNTTPTNDSSTAESSEPQSDSAVAQSGGVTIKGEVWVDNWFTFYLGEQLIKEDSVSITTERSFNAETFTFTGDYPLMLNFIVKDFKQNDTGLEYIGQGKQQMGDGGFIAQFTDTATGQVVTVTNNSWKCTVIHAAPLDKSCAQEGNPVAGQGPCGFTSLAEPTDWKSLSFDDSAWSNASLYSANQVRPKDGYDRISWNPTAQFIWTSDLETHNTLLCRLKVYEP